MLSLSLNGLSWMGPVIMVALLKWFVESVANVAQHALQFTKKSRQNIHLMVVGCQSMPVDFHLPSPLEMPFRQCIHTMIPTHIQNKELATWDIHNCLHKHADISRDYHDMHLQQLSPLYATQDICVRWHVATLDPCKNHWLAPQMQLYLMRTPSRGEHRCICRNLHEYSKSCPSLLSLSIHYQLKYEPWLQRAHHHVYIDCELQRVHRHVYIECELYVMNKGRRPLLLQSFIKMSKF